MLWWNVFWQKKLTPLLKKLNRSGLGLAITSNLLKLSNSKLNIESKIGKGSKFWFELCLELKKNITKIDRLLS